MRGFFLLASFLGVSAWAFAQDPPTSATTTSAPTSAPTSQPASRPTAPVQSYKPAPPPVVVCYDCYAAVSIERIYFPKGSASPLKDSYAVLDEVVKTLQEHPEIVRLEIGGHADPTTEGLYADKIALKRAKAVEKYLISQGIEPKRLTVRGYAARLSLNESRSKEERAENRRVEFYVLPP